jgi:hypothetical protein
LSFNVQEIILIPENKTITFRKINGFYQREEVVKATDKLKVCYEIEKTSRNAKMCGILKVYESNSLVLKIRDGEFGWKKEDLEDVYRAIGEKSDI